MNRSPIWLTFAAMAGFLAPVSAAPVPIPGKTSQGPITDTLRLLGMLPRTAPLLASRAVARENGEIELERRSAVYETRQEVVTVKTEDGKASQVVRTVTQAVPITRAELFKVESCKFFLVSKEGKLEAVEAAKAAAMLKKKTAVLTGDSVQVDPRNLELVKPGTLYIIPHTPKPTAPPPLPDIPRN